MIETKIKSKLENLIYNSKNNKSFYSLNDIFKEFKLKNYNESFKIIQNLKKQLIEISYPIKNLMQYKKENNKVYDIYLSQTGVFLVFASLAKYLKTEEEKQICYLISKASYKKDFIFYPENRFLYRQDYIETTKSLRSRVKKIYEYDDYITISERLNTLYHTIICAYYNVENSTELCLKKLNNANKNYLDYISLRELKDLQEIQNKMLFQITKIKSSDYLQIARHEALIKRKNFIADYGITPLYYDTHTNKPLTMLKKFNKLRENLNIDEKTLSENIDTFEK